MCEDCEAILIDVKYAIKQLEQFKDIGRALEALERVELRLTETADYDE